MQLLLWSSRWGFGLAKRTTDATASHWNQLVYHSLCSDLFRARTVGQPAKWQALSVKIGVMRSHQTRRFKIFHGYVCMSNMCNTPACVCMCVYRHICVSMNVETRSWSPQLFSTFCGLHVYLWWWWGLGCVHVYTHACEGQKFRMSFFLDYLLLYF